MVQARIIGLHLMVPYLLVEKYSIDHVKVLLWDSGPKVIYKLVKLKLI